MDVEIRKKLLPGTRVRVIQQIPARHYVLPTEVRGTVLSYCQRQTGSWFAHALGDRLWLDRLVLQKDDGEITTLNLDEYTRVEIEQPAASSGQPAAQT